MCAVSNLLHSLTILSSPRNIKAIPATLTTLFRELTKQTGWVGVMMVGGPVPSDGGRLLTFW